MTFAIRCILNAPLIFVYLLMLAPYVCGRPLDDYTQTVSFLIKMELSTQMLGLIMLQNVIIKQ